VRRLEDRAVRDETRVSIKKETDIVRARQAGRALAVGIGFSSTDQVLIATAISEVARNIISYAVCGFIDINEVQEGRKHGMSIVAEDEGPGIVDIDLAMKDGYSTGQSLGMGLPGARRLMDEFEIASLVGEGTTVTLKKWLAAGARPGMSSRAR
jgi:serine/threonine-protein kinase RsbT